MVRSCNPCTRRLEASPGGRSGHNGAVGGRYPGGPHPQAPMSHTLAAADADRIVKSDAEWRAQLTPEQYRVMRQHGTERAGTSASQARRPLTPLTKHLRECRTLRSAAANRSPGPKSAHQRVTRCTVSTAPLPASCPRSPSAGPKFSVQHGVELVDEYAWLRADNWQEVMRDPAVLDPRDPRLSGGRERLHRGRARPTRARCRRRCSPR